ncbi:LytTR family DNA-binding domain-containing protein [Mucilaginibacter sp. UR6-11]|uniref:LytR/AlgR family response regulator transcription factor n=1 Tax=Mucilaginibacter sp. UR6-11 TaxID=1435644 RepID=UPI001E346054|nr:LytTR family DNA-binding domain-containing protein [Mucilaginibacter sp. UR6-11]MCC8424466.1 LytTR family DNA-binding domain-containing protein [Mucilaginibacter sp. UR6-11]
MEITCVIIDDEPNNIQNLQNILGDHCPDVTIVAIAQNADDGIAAIKQHLPALVLLDIQMPEKSGFEVLKAFAEPNFEVIFITAYDQYGIQAIKFSALDYLLKPINISELKNAIEKAGKKISVKNKDHKLENLIEYMMRGQKDVPKIALPTLKEIRYIKIDEIIRCEASDNYTTFYTTAGEHLLVCKTLKEFSELLQLHGFIRTHQSHLVNINFVKSLLKEDGGILLMNDGTKIPISRQNKEEVKAALKRML